MNEEVMRVLRMLEEGKIDSEKAGELIEALKATKKLFHLLPTMQIKCLKLKLIHQMETT